MHCESPKCAKTRLQLGKKGERESERVGKKKKRREKRGPSAFVFGRASATHVKLLRVYVNLISNKISPVVGTRSPAVARMGQLYRLYLQGGPKKRIPNFIFGITSVIHHRF